MQSRARIGGVHRRLQPEQEPPDARRAPESPAPTGESPRRGGG